MESWNRVKLKSPAFSAHRMPLNSKEVEGTMMEFMEVLRTCRKDLEENTSYVKSEEVVLKQLLYKLSTVFRHEKTVKILKLIKKCISKFLSMQLLDTIDCMIEQHTLPQHGNFMFVSSKPNYEHVLVQYQGAARLLAQLLCYCQHSAQLNIQRMKLGHFTNILLISLAVSSRIWATSVHMIKIMMELFQQTKKVYDSGHLPQVSMKYLPDNYQLPVCLKDWLQSDPSLEGVSKLISTLEIRSFTVQSIWNSIPLDIEDETDDLTELKNLVNQSQSAASLKRKLDHEFSLDKDDVGEVVSREEINRPAKKRKKKKKKGPQIN